MGKLTINKQEVIKAIKTFKFNITNKAELRAIKKIDLDSIEFEEVKATIQIGHLHGSMIAAGARDDSQSPDFVTSLDQDFHTDAFPLLVDGSEDAAFAYAIANNYLSDGALEYPFKKNDLNKAAITLASKYYESYLTRLNLILKEINVNEVTFDEEANPEEYKVWIVKIKSLLIRNATNSLTVGYFSEAKGKVLVQNIHFYNIPRE